MAEPAAVATSSPEFPLDSTNWTAAWSVEINPVPDHVCNSLAVSQKHQKVYSLQGHPAKMRAVIYGADTGIWCGLRDVPDSISCLTTAVAAMDHIDSLYIDTFHNPKSEDLCAGILPYDKYEMELCQSHILGMRGAPRIAGSNKFAWDLDEDQFVFFTYSYRLSIAPKEDVSRTFVAWSKYAVPSAQLSGSLPAIDITSICIDSCGRIFAAEANGEIKVYSRAGEPLGRHAPVTRDAIRGLAFLRAQGYLIVSTHNSLFALDVTKSYPQKSEFHQ